MTNHGGERYSTEMKAEARGMRSHGMSCPAIARDLGVSLRTAQVWTSDVEVAALARTCRQCGREFTVPVRSGGHPGFCSDSCARYGAARWKRTYRERTRQAA